MQVTQLTDEGSGRLSFLVVDEHTKKAILIDPVEAQFERDLSLVKARGLRLLYVAETRPDPSGRSGAELIREQTGARFVASDLGTPCADIVVRQGDTLELGELEVRVVATQDDDGRVVYKIGDRVFGGTVRPPRVEGILGRVGRTPLVELVHLSPHAGVRLFAKLEGANPSGSIKDRIALGLVMAAEERGELRPGMTLVEASTGNTAIALAMVARQRGYRIKVMLPEGVPPSIWDTLQLLGAEIDWCKPCAGMKGAIQRAREEAERIGGYALRQFSDPGNVRIHYETTAVELVDALDRIDVFVAGIGTGGTITGVGRRLRERHPDVRIVGVEPATGEKLQGLQCLDDAFAPPLFDIGLLDRRLRVTAARSLQMMRMVAEREGIVAGVSSGATLSAALREAERLQEGNIVVMFSDGGWKYLPTRPWDAAAQGDHDLDEVHWW